MHQTFQALTLSYKTASVEVREQVALSSQEAHALLEGLRDSAEAQDWLVLSTCNRTEIYYAAAEDLSGLIITRLATIKGYDLVNDNRFGAPLRSFFRFIDNHEEAVRHLFEVSIGLESQVIGDIQLINQVKQAYQLSADLNVAGPFLHRLLHTIFFANKRVTTETPFRSGAASVAYAAAELVETLASQWRDPHVLILGLGEMGRDVASNLRNANLGTVTVCNRTLEKAEDIAEQYQFSVRPFAEYQEAIKEAQIIVSSVAVSEPLIKASDLVGLEPTAVRCFIDLSMPRSIDPACDNTPGVVLYDIDQIQSKASEALAARMACIPQVKNIVEEALSEFGNWSQEMVVSPTIQKLKTALETIRQEEMSRHLKNLSDSEAALIDKVTKGMMQKIIKLPVLHLKAACRRGEAETLIDVLNDLFDLEHVSVE